MMNYDELLMTFKEKIVREIVRLTIPEGYTVDEIIDLFLENGIGGTREDWIAAVNDLELYSNFAFVQALIGNTSSDRTYALEGYLFPDTYDFYTDAKASQIIYKLLNRFNNIFKDEFYTRSAELGYTVDEIITLASMIEKETRLYNEFELVSSVFHNRLHNAATYPCLESDATIMYAIQHDTGSRKEQLLHEDLSYNSPYNTYTHQGLPPALSPTRAIKPSPARSIRRRAIITTLSPARTARQSSRPPSPSTTLPWRRRGGKLHWGASRKGSPRLPPNLREMDFVVHSRFAAHLFIWVFGYLANSRRWDSIARKRGVSRMGS